MKKLIKEGGAAVCANDWTVNDNRAEGARMIRQTTKVMLRAFNGECDAAAANVSSKQCPQNGGTDYKSI
jgi:hypothetical protein